TLKANNRPSHSRPILTAMIPRIALTPGEPAGIGPELAIKLASARRAPDIAAAQIIAIADPELLRQEAARQGKTLRLLPFQPDQPAEATPADSLHILPVALTEPASPGHLCPANGPYVLETLRLAADGCKHRAFDAIV